MTHSCIALIPARSGSKRIADKNIRKLNEHPLLAYTISAASSSAIFTDIVVSTDSEEYKKIAEYYGASVPFMREKRYATDESPDIEWILFTLERLEQEGKKYDCFCILRPTSPFRLPSTICRAWDEFCSHQGIDSLRAVEKCSQHPGKMWVVEGDHMHPLLPFKSGNYPWHSMPYQSLPEIFVQNASLEIAWVKTVYEKGTIAGSSIIPFYTKELEGFDINHPEDWIRAEELIIAGETLPVVKKNPYV